MVTIVEFSLVRSEAEETVDH